MNAFEVLGLPADADTEQIHNAYRALVKKWHPDRYEGTPQQHEAQQMLIKLNLAYEEAMQLAGNRASSVTRMVTCEEAIELAERQYRNTNFESALRQLCRTEQKNAEWFCMEGKILLALKQYSSSHQAYREAVRLNPQNKKYREGALEAALQMKKHNKPAYKVADWLDGLLHPRKAANR